MTVEGDLRQQAYNKLEAAKRNGVKGSDLATLQSAYDAALARENSAKGSSGQAGKFLGF